MDTSRKNNPPTAERGKIRHKCTCGDWVTFPQATQYQGSNNPEYTNAYKYCPSCGRRYHLDCHVEEA